MAKVLSVSIPDQLWEKWHESDRDISPSAIFQSALESELDNSNRALVYWSSRALSAEKKLKLIEKLIKTSDQGVKKFLLFNADQF